MPLGFHKAALFGIAGASTESVVLLLSQTVAAVSSVEFTADITSKYTEYIFRFYNIAVASNGGNPFQWQVDASGGVDGYNDIYITSSFFRAYHYEGGAEDLNYVAGQDEANTQGFADIIQGVGTEADNSFSGELHLYNPSSTTYVKQWHGRVNSADGTFQHDNFSAGYWNTTSAINAVKFQHQGGGNFSGTIKMWGVK